MPVCFFWCTPEIDQSGEFPGFCLQVHVCLKWLGARPKWLKMVSEMAWISVHGVSDLRYAFL